MPRKNYRDITDDERAYIAKNNTLLSMRAIARYLDMNISEVRLFLVHHKVEYMCAYQAKLIKTTKVNLKDDKSTDYVMTKTHIRSEKGGLIPIVTDTHWKQWMGIYAQ